MKLSTLIQIVLIILLVLSVYLVITNQVTGRNRVIMIVFVLVVGIYLFIKLPIFRDYNLIVDTPASAKEEYEVAADKLKEVQGSYAISYWSYIDDWNYRIGEEKMIINRGGAVRMYLNSHTNDLNVDLSFIDTESTDDIEENLTIQNIGLQKWNNITMSVNDRTVDLYLNGKLVHTKAMKNVINSSQFNLGNLVITPEGGYGGFISKIRFYNRSITPQTAWDIYREGYGGSFLNYADRYNLKMMFYEESVLKKEIDIF